jgi:CHAT domain-containing protein
VRAAELVEAVRRLIPGGELRARRFAEQARVYHDLVALELRRPRLGRLFSYVEHARGRGFRDFAARTDRHPASRLLDEQRTRLGSLTHQLEELELSEPDADGRRQLTALRRQIATLEREMLAAWRRSSEQERVGPREQFHDDIDSVRGALRRDEALVSYFVTGECVLAMVLSRDEQSYVELPVTASELRAALGRVEFQLESAVVAASRPRTNLAFLRRAADSALLDLYRQIVAPVELHLPATGRLTFVPHAFLHSVPFECLHDGDRYVDERWAVSRLPLADLAGHRRRRLDGRTLLCGTVKAGPASVRAELRAVAAALPDCRSVVVEDPTTAELIGHLPAARLLHLVTHGVHRADNPLLSRLTTADGALFLIDILQQRLSAELVVLSACGTGRVFSGEGEDLHGVALAFLSAGAHTLVASLWRVDDRATLALMQAFYRHYTARRGVSAAEALRRAGQEVRAERDHPFFWGGFCVYGT